MSQIFDFSALAAPKLRFWYHMYGATMGTMHVDVDTTGLGNWVLDVRPSWTANVNAWQERIVDLSAYAGRPSVRLRIRATTGTSFTSDMAVDDIEVFDPQPYDLEAYVVSSGGGCGNSPTSPVTLQLINAGTLGYAIGDTIYAGFEVNSVVTQEPFVLTSAFGVGDTMSFTFQTGTVDLSGPSLVSITAWSSLALDITNGNDTTSTMAIGIPIITAYPYFENFDAGQNGWRITNNNFGTWAFGTPAKPKINTPYSAPNSFVTGGLGSGTYQNGDNSFVEGPCFDFSGMCEPVIDLRVWWNAEFSWDGANITASTDGGMTWNLIGNFGDPLNWYTDNTIVGAPGGSQSGWSGRASTSNGSNGWVLARHALTGLAGQANVKLRINFGTDASVVDDGFAFDDVHIYDAVDLGNDQLVCSPTTVTPEVNYGNGATQYAWNTGATTSSISITTTGTYAVTVTASPSCVRTDSFYVVIVDGNTVVDAGPDTTACGTSYGLDAGNFPNSSYLWSDGATSRVNNVTASGTYSVEVTTACGVLRDTVTVTLVAPPVVNLGPDVTDCDSLTLVANDGDSWLWSTGATSAAITVTSSGTYSVVATDVSGCTATDDIIVTLGQTPSVNLGADVVLCDGATAVLDAGNAGAGYLWSQGDTNQTITVSSAGTYSVTVTGTAGCMANDALVVTTGTTPTAGFTVTPGGGGLAHTFTNNATGSPTSYNWNFGDNSPNSTQANPTHTYSGNGNYTVTLIVTNACGSDTSSQTLIVVGNDKGFALGQLVVFPNPSEGRFWIEAPATLGDPIRVVLHDLSGKVVYARALNGTTAGSRISIELEDVAAGIYGIQLETSGGTFRAKAIVE